MKLPQILPEEVSNFAPHVIENMIQKSLNQVNLEKSSSQPQSIYEAAATLTEFELKKILINKMNSSESYLTNPEHRECYDATSSSKAMTMSLNLKTEAKSRIEGGIFVVQLLVVVWVLTVAVEK
nr:hypothetical protein [Tanacetum cinerariifolium]